MAKEFKIKARIVGKDDASPAVGKVQNRFAKLGKFLKVGFVAAAAAAVASLVALSKGISSIVSAANESEEALTAAGQAMATAGTFSEDAFKSVQKMADELSRTTTVSDETALQMFSLARGFTTTNEEAEKVVKVAADFSRTAKINIEEAVRRIGRSFEGSVDDISKFATGIKDLTKEELRAGKQLDVLSEATKGQAVAFGKTFTGSIVILQSAFADLTSTLGTSIIQNKTFRAAIKSVTDFLSSSSTKEAIKNFANRLGEWVVNLIAVAKAIAPVLIAVKNFIGGIVDLADSIKDLVTFAISKAIEKLKTFRNVFEPVVRVLAAVSSTVADAIEKFDNWTDGLNKSAEAADKNKEEVDKLTDSFKNNSEATDANIKKQKEVKEALEASKEETEEAEEAIDDFTESIEEETLAMIAHRDATIQATSALATLSEQVRFTSRDFDELSDAQGRSAAVTAGLAGGGVIRGNRIFLPGGGSRFLTDPGIVGRNSGRFNIDGTPSRF